MKIEDAEVVLNLEFAVHETNRRKFVEFCKRAFPIYESLGGSMMMLYEDSNAPGKFNEVGYYRTMADYKRAERAIEEDSVQSALIKEWHSLLVAPPKVTIYVKTMLD